jgi:ABC-type multidrug transport system ATPase subunit
MADDVDDELIKNRLRQNADDTLVRYWKSNDDIDDKLIKLWQTNDDIDDKIIREWVENPAVDEATVRKWLATDDDKVTDIGDVVDDDEVIKFWNNNDDLDDRVINLWLNNDDVDDEKVRNFILSDDDNYYDDDDGSRESGMYRLFRACKDDLDKFCDVEGVVANPTAAVICLEEHIDDVTPICRYQLGKPTFGGCNEEAMTFCSKYTDPKRIQKCLTSHMDDLSRSCAQNVMVSAVNPWEEERNEERDATIFVALMSIIYLSIPVLIVFCAMYYVSRLETEQANVIREQSYDPDTTLHLGGRADEEMDGDVSLTLTSSKNARRGGKCPWVVAFHNFSYWAPEPNKSLIPCRGPKKMVRTLYTVSGECSAGGVTAIMGPIGSGKADLLKLLAGQMTDGEITGLRAVCGKVLLPELYDNYMRSQGFVAKEDHLMETLTVWQILTYSALLRIPKESIMTMKEKLRRAAKIMKELDLVSIAHSVIGGTSADGAGISRGQRKRLGIAIELLADPKILLLEEPTSGLDETESLKLLALLQKIASQSGTAVALTIYQPRPEAFSLFSSLVLLGVGGHTIYSGPTSKAAPFLASAPMVSISMDGYTNAGDYIMDVLDKEYRTAKKQLGSRTSRLALNTGPENAGLEMVKMSGNLLSSAVGKMTGNTGDGDRGNEEEHAGLMTESDDGTYNPMNSPGQKKKAGQFEASSWKSTGDYEDEIFTHDVSKTFRQTDVYSRLVSYIKSGFPGSSGFPPQPKAGKKSVLGKMKEAFRGSQTPSVETPAFDSVPTYEDNNDLEDFGDKTHTGDMQDVTLETGDDYTDMTDYEAPISAPTGWLSQLCILFARRLQMFRSSRKEMFLFVLQVVFIGFAIALAVSYQPDTDLEEPFQAVILLFLVSTYAMVIQFYVLVPEYLGERKLVKTERSSHVLSLGPYICSAMLTEVPRAIIESLFLMSVAYIIHPLNDKPINSLFAFVTLMVGVCAWQSMICLCSMLSDDRSIVYTICMFVLGTGALFGGLIVRIEKIPKIFRPFYHGSVVAVTQRALVVNDLLCCYLTSNCNAIAQEYGTRAVIEEDDTHWQAHSNMTAAASANGFCPPELVFSGDGSDEGNLGRMYLKSLGLEDLDPFQALVYLFVANILCRVLAGVIMYYRERASLRLKEQISP